MDSMQNENGRGTNGPGTGDAWSSGAGAGAGGFGHRPVDGPQRGWSPYGGASGHGDGGSGGYGHVQPGPGGHYGAGAAGAPGGQYGPGAPGGVGPVGIGPAGGAPGDGTADGGRGGGERRSGRGLLAAGMIAAMLASGGLGGWIGATVAGGSETSLSRPVDSAQPMSAAPDGTVEAVADKVLPSVVSIDVAGRAGAGEGSGVILSADGLIITNNHVVDIAQTGGRIQVRLHDGSRADARIVGTDPTTDIAVIKAETDRPLTPITLGTSSTLDEGQAVAAVGSPLGLSGTVTVGIVSALDRPVRAGGERSDQSTVIDAIQTDAAVNPGNSGGALVNMNGELIGINSAIASTGGSGSIGLGFAIPVDQARRIADQIIKQGYATRAVLGVSVSDSPETAGALVRSVEPGGPAAGAGIGEGAVITKVGDRVIDNGDALVAAIRSRAPGDTVTVTYAARVGGTPETADVALGEAR